MYKYPEKVLYLCVHLRQHLLRHYWKQETLEVYWVSETAKTQSPKSRPPVSVYISTDYCSCRGEALGGAKIPTVRYPCFL